MRKWLFSIFLWLCALAILVYFTITIFVEKELFYDGGILCCYFITILMFIGIGYVNAPRKGGK